jgi:hypothetical protein
MNVPATQEQASSNVAEAVPLAQEMHAAFAQLVEEYKRYLSLTPQEAVARAAKPGPGEEERTLNAPPKEITWLQLHSLAQRDPELAVRRWEMIKQAAMDELQSGHRASTALFDSLPWERAQFLAIRTDLAQQWQPRGGIEWQLIDTMALAQSGLYFWLKAMDRWACIGAEVSGRDCKDELGRSTPRLSAAESIDRAGAMVDRFSKMFQRALRSLCEFRRHLLPNVVVQNAGQVNVGGQQLNVAQGL